MDIVEIPLFHIGDATTLANKAKVDASGNLYTSTVVTNTSAVSGNVGLNAGANLVGKFGIDQTTPGTTNAVQLSGPGTSLANPLFVSSEEGSGFTTKISGQLSSIALATGASASLVAPFVTTPKQGTLRHVTASSSVPIKVELQSVLNSGVATTVVTMFTSVGSLNCEWKEYMAYEIQAQAAANGTSNGFVVKITNMDSLNNAADVYATIVWSEQ